MVSAPSIPSSKPFTADLHDEDLPHLIGARAPLGFAGGDENLYRYCSNNPLNRTDPTGLSESGGSGGASVVCDPGEVCMPVVEPTEFCSKGRDGPRNAKELFRNKLPQGETWGYFVAIFTSYKPRQTAGVQGSGHAWVMLVGPGKDNYVVKGFSPDVGKKGSVSMNEPRAPGKISDDSKREFVVARLYEVDRHVYDRVQAMIARDEAKPPEYHAANNNCTQWVMRILRIVGRPLKVDTVAVPIADQNFDVTSYYPEELTKFLVKDNLPASNLYDYRPSGGAWRQ